MSLTNPYLPNADNDRVTWMNNFNAKLPGYATALGITAAEIASVKKDTAMFAYIVNLSNIYKQTSQNIVAFKNLLKHQGAGDGPLGAIPGLPPIGTAPPAVPTPATNKSVLTLIFLYFSFLAFSQNIDRKPNLISFDHEVLSLPTLYLTSKYNYPTNNEIFLIGNINFGLNSIKKIKKTLFFGYQYHNYTYYHPTAGRYIYNFKNISIERGSQLYFLSGVNLLYSKKKQYSGIVLSLGVGGGLYKQTGDNYLYNSRTAWCNSIDVGYIIGFKHFYLKPFVGLLSIFNLQEFIDYNNGEVISAGQLNYYSQNNPDKTNLYKSSTSPNTAQILIKYKYAGLTNATFLPRGLFSIGFTF